MPTLAQNSRTRISTRPSVSYQITVNSITGGTIEVFDAFSAASSLLSLSATGTSSFVAPGTSCEVFVTGGTAPASVDILEVIPTVQDAAFDPLFGKTLVGTARDKFRDEFFSFDTTNNWETIQTGSGMTVSVAGAANGARYLNIATGTTNSAETIIQSRSSFKLPVKLAVGLSMSQRIANQEVFVELVSVDASGTVETDATFASTNLNNALNAASFKFDSTTAANAIYIVRGYGVSELASGSTAFTGSTTAATGTTPNFIPASVYEINADMEEVVFNTRSIDSLAAVNLAVKRTQNLPDPAKNYKIRIRVRNLTGAASTTDVRVHFVRVLDTTRFTVDFSRHMGRTTDIADSIPAAITNTPAVTLSGTSNAVAGTAAQGATASGNPVFTGGVAKTAQPTARTDGQIVAPLLDKVGRTVLRQGQIRDLTTLNAAVTLTSTTETTLVAAAASIFNDLQAVEIASTAVFSGTPTGVRLDFRDVAAGTVRFSVALPAGGGVFNWNRSWMGSELKQTTVNTAWTVQLAYVGGTSPAVSTGDIRITAQSIANI